MKLFLAFAIILGPAMAMAANDGCVHKCAAVCASAQEAPGIAKEACDPKPQHICYEKYGVCERATNGRCMWKLTDKLTECVQYEVGKATAEIMK